MKCPHCNQEPNKKAWPFCSWCKLLLVEMDELELDPKAEIPTWKKKETKWAL